MELLALKLSVYRNKCDWLNVIWNNNYFSVNLYWMIAMMLDIMWLFIFQIKLIKSNWWYEYDNIKATCIHKISDDWMIKIDISYSYISIVWQSHDKQNQEAKTYWRK